MTDALLHDERAVRNRPACGANTGVEFGRQLIDSGGAAIAADLGDAADKCGNAVREAGR